jgi:hypothetical protein
MAELGRLKKILATIERLKANDFRAEIDRLGGFLKENFREDLAVGDDYVGTAIRLLKELKKNRVAAQEILQGIFSPVPVVGKEATSPYDDKAEYALRSMAEIQKRMSILGLEPWTSPQGGPVEQIMKYLEGYQRLLAENIRLKEEHKAHIEKMRSSNYLRQIHRLRDCLLRQGVLSADSSEDIVNAAISMLDNDKNDLRRIRNDRDDLLQKLSKAQDKIKVLVETLRIYQHEEGRLRTLILEYFPNEEVPLGYTDTAIDLLKKVKNRGRMVAEIKVNLDEGKTAREAAEIALRELGEHPAQKDLDRLQEYMNSLGWDTPPQNPVTAAIEGIEHLRKINKDLRRDDTITAIMKELDGKKEVELTLSLDNEAVARCIMDLVRKTNKGFFKRIRGL